MGRLNFLLVFALVFRLFIIDALADDELSQIAFTKPLGKDFEEDYQRGNEAIQISMQRLLTLCKSYTIGILMLHMSET